MTEEHTSPRQHSGNKKQKGEELEETAGKPTVVFFGVIASSDYHLS